MIERARESIEVESFVYDVDFSGKVFTQALLKRAREGVRVRVLVDGFKRQLDDFYAHALAREGVEVRYYNNFRFPFLKRYNYRNHRKLLVVDGVEMLTGGRNISDMYFELGSQLNFLDRDIWVSSPLVAQTALETFNHYWDSFVTERPAAVSSTSEPYRKAEKFLQLTESEQKKLKDLRAFARGQLAVEESSFRGTCEQLTFVTDSPYLPYMGYGHIPPRREVSSSLRNQTLAVEHSLHVESGYVVFNDAKEPLLDYLLDKKIQVSLLTNGFAATDWPIVSSAFHANAAYWIERGMQAFLYTGSAPPEQDFFLPETRSSRFGVHSKTFVFDEHSFFIGSYNLDPARKISTLRLAFLSPQSPVGRAGAQQYGRSSRARHPIR